MKRIEPCNDQFRINWEMQVINSIEELLNIDTSDAQGIVMAKDEILNDAWEKGLSAEETAKLLTQRTKKRLGRHLYQHIQQAVKTCGTYEPNQVLSHFEEYLTFEEIEIVRPFLIWVHEDEDNRQFGWGNYEMRYEQFQDQK